MASGNIEHALNSTHTYSRQALIYLKLVPDFDMEEFETWKRKHLNIGGSEVMEYLAMKDEEIHLASDVPIKLKNK